MIYQIKPYLRTMSSMTNLERRQLEFAEDLDWRDAEEFTISHTLDFILKHHFDYRGLIPLNLAIAVTEENNPYK